MFCRKAMLPSGSQSTCPALAPRCRHDKPAPLKTRRPPRRYRGTSLIRKCTPLGPYRRLVPRVLGWSWGGGCFLAGEVPLYSTLAFLWMNVPLTCCFPAALPLHDSWTNPSDPGELQPTSFCDRVSVQTRQASTSQDTAPTQTVQGYLTYEKAHPPRTLP